MPRRTCNTMTHLSETVDILALIGVQGNVILAFQQWNIEPTDHAGLLFARAYAITDHKRLVLVVLGILDGCAIVPSIVCVHVCISMTIHDGRPSQAFAIVNSCDLTSTQLHTVNM